MQRILLSISRQLKHANFRVDVRLLSTQKMDAQDAPKSPIRCGGVPTKIRPNAGFKTIDTPEFHSIFSLELKDLIAVFRKYNHEIRVAGGAVRDILMKIHPTDVDLATTATPGEMKQMFEKEQLRMINAKGEKHGTITVRLHDKQNFEVTTLRVDVLTDGRHAEVEFTTDWQLDANRRDLTINSMFLGFDGTVYDYFYGYDDLLARRIVFVGDANVRIQEDYLRILRYFRFYGRIALEANKHDEATLEAIRANVAGLKRISGERIWSELHKIVVGNFASELVLKMLECGMAPFCGLPQEPNTEEFKRLCEDLKQFPKPHYPILFLIALLHNHEQAIQLHERLKLSAFERDLALFITQQRVRVDKDYSTLRDYQKLCLQPYAKREFVEQLLKYSNKLELYHALKAWQTPNFPLNGNLLKERGCPLGRKMGLIMSELRLIWANSDFTMTAEELLETHLPEIMQRYASPPISPRKKVKTSD